MKELISSLPDEEQQAVEQSTSEDRVIEERERERVRE